MEEIIQLRSSAVLTSANCPLLLITQHVGWSPGESELDADEENFTRIIQYVAYMLCVILQHVIMSSQIEVYSLWDAEMTKKDAMFTSCARSTAGSTM
jgi:hypothetical protein